MLAAYYGLKKRAALADFKQRFLLRNAEESLQIDLNLLTIAKGLQGGINDPTQFPRWLDDNLYRSTRPSRRLLYQRRPYIWINASDIYNRTPFVFGPVLFGALCSDLSNYPISLAVAASAAVPVVFAPVVIQGYPGGCRAAAAGTGCIACAATRMRHRCCETLPTRCSATIPARFAM